MYSMQLASCLALTLALLVSSAPTSSSKKETQQHLEQLLLDLQELLKGINVSACPSCLWALSLVFLPKVVF